jgi:hypothetical protein
MIVRPARRRGITQAQTLVIHQIDDGGPAPELARVESHKDARIAKADLSGESRATSTTIAVSRPGRRLTRRESDAQLFGYLACGRARLRGDRRRLGSRPAPVW